MNLSGLTNHIIYYILYLPYNMDHMIWPYDVDHVVNPILVRSPNNIDFMHHSMCPIITVISSQHGQNPRNIPFIFKRENTKSFINKPISYILNIFFTNKFFYWNPKYWKITIHRKRWFFENSDFPKTIFYQMVTKNVGFSVKAFSVWSPRDFLWWNSSDIKAIALWNSLKKYLNYLTSIFFTRIALPNTLPNMPNSHQRNVWYKKQK